MRLSKFILILFIGCFLNSNSQILKGGDTFVKNIFGNTQQVTARISWFLVISRKITQFIITKKEVRKNLAKSRETS